MKKQLVPVATFDTFVEGELYRDRLIASGIPAILAGPDTTSTFGLYVGNFGKVTILVPKKAAALLARSGGEPHSKLSATRIVNCRSVQPRTPMRRPCKREKHRSR